MTSRYSTLVWSPTTTSNPVTARAKSISGPEPLPAASTLVTPRWPKATNTLAPSFTAAARAFFAARAGSVMSIVPVLPGATRVGASGLVTPIMATLTPATSSTVYGAIPVRLPSRLRRLAPT